MSTNIRELVEAQVAEKIAKGEALAERVAAIETAQIALEDATRNAATARREALNAGWTETELKKLGLASAGPARKRRTRTATGHAANEIHDGE